jgi:hypothetical protein
VRFQAAVIIPINGMVLFPALGGQSVVLAQKQRVHHRRCGTAFTQSPAAHCKQRLALDDASVFRYSGWSKSQITLDGADIVWEGGTPRQRSFGFSA